MGSEKKPFYDPVPPTYDEALASSWQNSDDGVRHGATDESETQSLMRRGEPSTGGARRPCGYRAPTVETDDEDSLLERSSEDELESDGDDDEETSQVRREMQEIDMEEPSTWAGSVWGKRIGRMGFKLSLTGWKRWWRPRLPRLRLGLPSPGTASGVGSGTGDEGGEGGAQGRRWELPKINKLTLLMGFARLVALMVILAFVYFLFASGILGGPSSRAGGGLRFEAEDLRQHILDNVEAMWLRASVQHFSNYAHMAGTEGDYAMAMDVEAMFRRAGLDQVEVDEYQVYVNYPRQDGRAVQILDESSTKAAWTAKLEEEDAGGETAGRQTYAFHGHSKSGEVTGPLVYANYGSREDYRALQEQGIDTRGAIALVRHGGTAADGGLQVKAAELAGFAGCLVFGDPGEEGFARGPVAPQGRWMPADGVRRGSVSLRRWMAGDVLTPGWESKKGRPRLKANETAGLVGIPSLPLAWRDAHELLRRLEGDGRQVAASWQGGGPRAGGWWTGDGRRPLVRLRNQQDEREQQAVWNVYGRIAGTEQTARTIIVGNARDAWSFGAVDPHSGTAVLIELARILGGLVRRGWRPLRTIELMSWDGAAYNLLGSTEYVEANAERLRAGAYAYVNLAGAVSGPELRAAGSPALGRALGRALERVVDARANATLRQLWRLAGGRMASLGGAGDYAAFQHMAGTSALDLGFSGERFAAHSSHERFTLVDEVLDPGFVYHALLGQVVGLLVLDLADRAVLPFGMLAYADALTDWVRDLTAWVEARTAAPADAPADALAELAAAAADVARRARAFEGWELEWQRQLLMGGGWEPADLGRRRAAYNDKMAGFETALLDLDFGGGIPNRTQFKHVVFGPQLWSGAEAALFPAIRDCVDAADWARARRLTAKTAALLRRAAAVLDMDASPTP